MECERVCRCKYILLRAVLLLFAFTCAAVMWAGTAQSSIQIEQIEGLDIHPEYDVVLDVSGDSVSAGDDVEVNILIRYGAEYGRGKVAGSPVKNLQKVYGKIVDVFIVSHDFSHFAHTRPEEFGDITSEVKAAGRFMVRHTFPVEGRYRIATGFSHKGQVIYKHFDMEVGGLDVQSAKRKSDKQDTGNGKTAAPSIFNPQSTILNPQSAAFDGYDVMLKVEAFPVVAKRKTHLLYHIQDEMGNDVEGLEVFMGTELHMVTWREDLSFFGYERTRPPQGQPGTVLLVPPIKTEIRYGTGILRNVLANGRMLIEHGQVKGLLPAGEFTFRVSDPEAGIKVEVGDWVEFWVDNTPESGIVITRIEPLAMMPTGDEDGVYMWAGNLPKYPGPDVPVEHVFPSAGRYVVFGQFRHEGNTVNSRFVVEVSAEDFSVGNLVVSDGDDDADKGLVVLTERERNGQMIYRGSKTASGRPVYIKQDDGSRLDASDTGITCLGCHGEDGRGGQEGGVLTSDIRYEYLTKPYGVTHLSGRKHPPYTDELLKTAISDGRDPAGNKLDPTMVRWEMSDSDMEDLCSYIHRLSEMGRPGVTNDTIRVGCVLDMSGPLAGTGMAAKEMIEAAFARINSGGKIYGRSLKLVVADGGNDPVRSIEAARVLVEQENVFCFMGNLGDAATKSVIPFLEEMGIAVIAPLSPTYQSGSVVEQKTFFLFPSIAYQARVMVDYIFRTKRDKTARPRVAAIYSRDEFGRSGLEAAKGQLAMYGNRLVAEAGYDYNSFNVGDIAEVIAKDDIETVLILTPDARIFTVVAEIDRLHSSPKYICNNMLVIKNVMKIPSASKRFVLVQNFSFAGKDNAICGEFLEIIKDVPLSARNVMIQMAAFTGTKLLEEGLRLAGRDLTRRSLIDGMERVILNTGLFGVVSYKPGRHDGDAGVFLVRPDEASGNFVPVSKWMRPTDGGGLF